MPAGGRRDRREARDDGGRAEQDLGHEHQRGPVVDLGGDPLGQVGHGLGRHPDDLDTGLREAGELPAGGVELPVGRHHAGPGGEVERRHEPHEEGVGAVGERDDARAAIPRAVVAQPGRPARPDPVGLGEGAVPLLVDERGRVVERLELALARDVGPRLVAVPGEQQPLVDARGAVVLRQPGGVGQRRARRPGALRHQNRLRTSHSGGNAGRSVLRRYAAPADPPVPIFAPMVRSTIFTWR